jgi:hypothetical protein
MERGLFGDRVFLVREHRTYSFARPGRIPLEMRTDSSKSVDPNEIRRVRFFAASCKRRQPSSSEQRNRDDPVRILKLRQQHPLLSSMFPTLQLLTLSIARPSGRLPPDLYGENGDVRLRAPAETSAKQRYDGHHGLLEGIIRCAGAILRCHKA